jgi:hypothetical protein
MKKAILTAAIILAGLVSYALPLKSNIEIQQYLANRIYNNKVFTEQNFEGTIKIKIDFDNLGITNVSVLTDVNEELKSQLMDIISDIPTKKVKACINEGTSSIVVPIKVVIEDNN